MELLEPIYTTVDSVRVRLSGKVNFQDKPEDEVEQGQLSEQLFRQLIRDAEVQVETDLRGRYAIPFQHCKTEKFSDLPDQSKRALRRVVDQRAVIEVLTTDFGSGTHVSGKEYSDDLLEKYQDAIDGLLGADRESRESNNAGNGVKRYRRTPPLEHVKLARGNEKADDGYKGKIINTDASTDDLSTFAEEHVNDPSRTYAGPIRAGNLFR